MVHPGGSLWRGPGLFKPHGQVLDQRIPQAPGDIPLGLTHPPATTDEPLPYFFNYYYFLNKFIYLFIYFWLRWVFVAARGLSLVVASGGCSSLRCAGFSLQWLLLLQSTGSRHVSFSSCGTRVQ